MLTKEEISALKLVFNTVTSGRTTWTFSQAKGDRVNIRLRGFAGKPFASLPEAPSYPQALTALMQVFRESPVELTNEQCDDLTRMLASHVSMIATMRARKE